MSQDNNQQSSEAAGEKIVVGIDGSEDSRLALDWALAHAKPGDHVEVIHTWTQPLMAAEAGYALDPKLFADSAVSVLEAEMDLVRAAHPDVAEVHGQCVEGHAGTALLKAAEDADMLVVGTRGRGGFVGLLLGSTSTYLAHHATCAVVIVPGNDQPAEG